MHIMSNLHAVQEAALGSPLAAGQALTLDFGPLLATVIPPTDGFPSYGVQIAGDYELMYEFASMAEALDFVVAEARLATCH